MFYIFFEGRQCFLVLYLWNISLSAQTGKAVDLIFSARLSGLSFEATYKEGGLRLHIFSLSGQSLYRERKTMLFGADSETDS